MLDAHQLNVFIVAAETLNFTKTAKHLHMTQPSVSQHIQSLESGFGAKLFERNGRHLELTDAGFALVSMARDFVQMSIRIEETMESLKGKIYGHLMVGCSTTPGKYILPQLLTQFHHRHPHVKVTCQVTNQRASIDMLCEGRVNFALTSTSRHLCSDAEFRHFICDPVALIAPLDHPWAQKDFIEPDELYDANFIMREEGSGTFSAVHEALMQSEIDIHRLQVLLTLGNSEAIALSVQEGLGVGFVSSMVVDRLTHDKVAKVKVRGLEICRDIFIGRQTRLPASAAQIAFWEFVQGVDQPFAQAEELALDYS
ncbi:MAG: LysR family transcriptional regulator [Anaerolineales bacterium]|nr:LysR family transcriptional regulator [Anaerolineales bacterium]